MLLGQGLARSQPGRGGGPGNPGAQELDVERGPVVCMCRLLGTPGTPRTHPTLFPVLGAELPVGLAGCPEHPHTCQPETLGFRAGNLAHPCWDLSHDGGLLNVLSHHQAVPAPNPELPGPLSSGFLHFPGTQETPWPEALAF